MADIDKYHSYQFTQHGMKAWRYYQIGDRLIHIALSKKEFNSFSPLSHAKMV